MRRPDIQLFLTAQPVHAGECLSGRVVLASRSRTAVEGVDVVLRGTERRYTGTIVVNNVPIPQYANETVISLRARATLPGNVLVPGEHEIPITFQLPEHLAPSYENKLTTIEYEIAVQVRIPWWPDSRAAFVVPVALPLRSPGDGGHPRVVSTARRLDRDELYIEGSIDSDVIAAGDHVTGSVSFQNVAAARIRRISLAFVGYDIARARSSSAEVPVHRFEAVIHEGPPSEGAPIHFRIALPEHAVPSFEAKLTALRWQLELSADGILGGGTSLPIPITVVDRRHAAPEAEARPKNRTAPPVGRERRVVFWGAVASHLSLDYDRDTSRISCRIGEVDLSIAPAASLKDDASVLVTARWPSLGIDLEVAERRWIDLLGRALPIDDEAFAKRFRTRARELAQAEAVLDEGARAALLRLERVAVDDEGFEVGSPRGALDAAELEALCKDAIAAARAFATAAGRVPPPAAIAAHADAWRAFANRTQARLTLGLPMIEGEMDGVGYAIAVAWREGDATPAGTTVRVELPAPLEAELELGSDALSTGDARALCDAIVEHAGASKVRVGPDAIEVALAHIAADPSALSPLLGTMVQLARALSAGTPAAGPYR